MLIHVVHILQLITYLSLENYENILAPKAECQHDVDVHLCMSTYPFYCPHSVYVLPVLFLTFNKQGEFLHISNTYRNVIWSLLWVQIFFLIWNLSIHIDFNFCFVFHTCVCVFFFPFFSWRNNLYLKGNKNLSWFGNFTSGKNYSHHFNKQIAEAERKKNINTKQIQQQNFSTRLLHNYQQQVGDTPKVFSTHLRMDNSLTSGQNFKAKFHFYVPQ